MARTVQGIAHTWQISDTPIGSGDAGEVFAVARHDQPEQIGVMKTPARIATGGTIQRQATQIEQEAQALALLDGLPTGKAHPPRLLDQAPDFTKGTSNYFLVSETAPGEALNALLAESRQSGKPFPRRVIITVLDALFDMFSRAHRAGVLWNDVKLEHIYWDNPSGKVGVIDWGNALFLDHQGQYTRPRWEDYQQMVDTLGNFLQSSAPELYADLGWDEFQGKTLDAALVSTLARRISYQQQVIALQVMEYQSLIRVVLGSGPTLEGLRKIKTYQEILERIGAPWQNEQVLKYSQDLIETALSAGDTRITVSTTALVWEVFDNTLALPWHLLREYCRQTEILTHKAFPDLAKHTLNADWEKALWTASSIAQQYPVPNWWRALIPVIRQQALQTSTPSPYLACQSLYQWAAGHSQADLQDQLEHMLKLWRTKGMDELGGAFDYELLDLVRDRHDLPPRLRSEIKLCFAQGEEIIRELIKAWTNANWDELPKAFRRVISWDPDRWGILGLSKDVQAMQTWLTELNDGPGIQGNAHTFLERMLTSRPRVEHSLGLSHWLSSLLTMLTAVLQGDPIASHHEAVRYYCPWLLPYPDIHATELSTTEIDLTDQQILLSAFITALKNWQDLTESLAQIRQRLPRLFPACQNLAQGFRTIYLLNTNLDDVENHKLDSDVPELLEGFQALQALISWRRQLADHDLLSALECLQGIEHNDWALIDQARSATFKWHHSMLPVLSGIQTEFIPSIDETEGSDPLMQQLVAVYQTCQEIKPLFAQIYTAGIYANLLEALEEIINLARTTFMDWRVALEHSADQAIKLVYLNDLEIVRHISSCFLRMTQHIYQAKLSLALLDEDQPTSITLQNRQIEGILYHLAAIEAELEPDHDKRRFPGYQASFKQIADAVNAEARQAVLQGLTKDHPFFAWLVKSTLT